MSCLSSQTKLAATAGEPRQNAVHTDTDVINYVGVILDFHFRKLGLTGLLWEIRRMFCEAGLIGVLLTS